MNRCHAGGSPAAVIQLLVLYQLGALGCKVIHFGARGRTAPLRAIDVSVVDNLEKGLKCDNHQDGMGEKCPPHHTM